MNAKVKDPVCGMEIEAHSDALQSSYGGTDYFFCSANCKDQFDKDPAKYAKPKSGCCGHGGHRCCH
ncbi:YHS domain-containing protein [Effusibacillus lacus]|uniref:TRASH domain-containing protein n=1 Tax=Effusibacillus lacus TaxID=1348429 RepID=A0A292YT77_9BACL|nr:YHS domain-containing protein [Effusibacillus lacus]TCS74965.1 YHS domain-containing protein [Effusibacillus lacus]GAX91634.1 hypothetical protein EFBL_3324 [Effusibacillus lacus]